MKDEKLIKNICKSINYQNIKLTLNAPSSPSSNIIRDTLCRAITLSLSETIYGWRIKFKKLSKKSSKTSTRDSRSAHSVLTLIPDPKRHVLISMRTLYTRKRVQTKSSINQQYDRTQLAGKPINNSIWLQERNLIWILTGQNK